MEGSVMIEASYPGRSAFRWVAIVGSLALTLALLPVTPASAQRTTENACPADADFEDPDFPDQAALSSTNEREIICVYNWGITKGQADGTFGTLAGLNRAQLATFVIRLLEAARVELGTEPAPADTFTDTDAIPAAHRDNVLNAAALDIVVGFADGSFRPTATVTRAQAASYLVRTQLLINEAYAISPEDLEAYIDTLDFDAEFTDIAGNVHEDNIVLLARLGVVGGYPDGSYRPGSGLVRGHMAALLARHLDVLADLDLDDLAPIHQA
jgi:endo-1,4-beta-xylanase